jgi:MerR family transcriptional regulator, copper efflux regulator
MLNRKDYMKIREAAKFVGVCLNTLRNWDRTGKIKSYRDPMSGYRLYLKSDLEEALQPLQVQMQELHDNHESSPS